MEDVRPVPFTPLADEDLAELRRACATLENPGLTARVANIIGGPIEKAVQALPADWSINLNKVVRRALFKALDAAVASLGETKARPASDLLHKSLVGISGGLGGSLGLASAALELPFSTTLMLRSIADIARSEGFDIKSVETKLNCLQVFALGGRSKTDDAQESAYWTTRAALGAALNDAAKYIAARRGLVDRTAPAIVRFISAIAARFGVVVSEQTAAKAVPVLGAAAGAAINVLFMEHFQDMARGHFTIKRLEAKYGVETVQSAYQFLNRQNRQAPPEPPSA